MNYKIVVRTDYFINLNLNKNLKKFKKNENLNQSVIFYLLKFSF